MKKYLVFILLISLNSCIKDLVLPFEKSDQKMVVNCLFSTDENWNVTLTRIRSFSDKTDSTVSNATVDIVPENNDTIHLQYVGDGNYSVEEKPLSGIQYQLIVKEPNSQLITAKSSIPDTVIVSSVNLSIQPAKFFSSPNLSDYDVLPLSLKVSAGDQPNFVRFRFYSFNTDWGYKRYSVTEQTIKTLREKGISEAFLQEISSLIGKSYTSFELNRMLWKIAEKYQLSYNEYANVVGPEIKVTTVNYRSPDAFLLDMIFANSNWLSNISRDTYNVLGEYKSNAEADIFVDYLPILNKNGDTSYKEEYWLELVGMSEDYYKYQKSYIKQVVNQSNPFSSVVEVYSNIQNGVGIFAGYNRQMVHLHDF